MKKKITIGILVIAILLCIFAVTSFSPRNTQNLEREVVFWTLQMNEFTPYMTDVITKFEYQNPDIKVKWIDVPFSEGEKRTLAAILSNNPPSLVNLNPDFSSVLAQKGALEEIPEEKLTSYNKELLNALKINGKIFAIPWYATSAVTIYNTDILKRADIKNPPKTYEEVGQYAKDVKDKTKSYIFMPTLTENDTTYKLLNKYGINSPNRLTDKASVRVFNFYRDLYKKDLIPKESVTQTHRESLEKYMSGDVAMIQAGANFLNIIKENAPNIYKKTDVAPQLTGTLGQYDFSLMNFVIPAKAKDKEDALKFALFLTNEENQLKLAKLTNVLTTNEKALKSSYYQKADSNDLMSKARVQSAKQLYKIEPVLKQQKSQKEVNDLLNTSVQMILIDNVKTENILESAAKKWDKLKFN